MKILKLRWAMLCIGAVLTLGFSHAVAQACADIDAGGNAYGSYDCRLIGECEGWCYYRCTCSNLFPGKTCNDVLTEAGFEMVQSGGGCY